MIAEEGPPESESGEPFEVEIEPPPWADHAVRMPLPPRFAPFGPEAAADDKDVVFFYKRAPAPGGRDAEDIMLRRVPRDVARRFRTAAGGRGLTHAQYLAALVELHEAMRALAGGGGDERVGAELERLGLTTVEV